MAKTKRSKALSQQQMRLSTSKFIVGALIGLGIGYVAVNASFVTGLITLATLLVLAAGAVFITQQRRQLKAGAVMGALVFGVVAISGVQYLGSSLAWHPKGSINKSVQNVTAGGPVADANNVASAVAAKPGDLLNYVITVSNIAPNAKKQYNDLAFVTISDTLPEGTELVDNPTNRTITDHFGTILPGKSVTKTYQVRVTSTTDGSVQQNTACYAGDSVVKDAPQKGCDSAFTKVVVPPAALPEPAPVEPVALPTQLPETGPSNVIIVGLTAIVTGYLFSAMYGYLGSRDKHMRHMRG